MAKPLQNQNGKRVTTLAQWGECRTEIVEDFEREVYGRIPANAPKVAWRVSRTVQGRRAALASLRSGA